MNKDSMIPLVIVTITMLMISACSGGQQQATLSKAEKDKIYIETVRDKYPTSAATGSDSLLLQLADGSCSAFESGASKADIVDIIRSKGSKAGEEIGFAVGVAVSIYCPEYSSQLKNG